MLKKTQTYCFDPLAVHFIMLVSFSEVQTSITFLADQKIRKVHLKSSKPHLLSLKCSLEAFCTYCRPMIPATLSSCIWTYDVTVYSSLQLPWVSTTLKTHCLEYRLQSFSGAGSNNFLDRINSYTS